MVGHLQQASMFLKRYAACVGVNYAVSVIGLCHTLVLEGSCCHVADSMNHVFGYGCKAVTCSPVHQPCLLVLGCNMLGSCCFA